MYKKITKCLILLTSILIFNSVFSQTVTPIQSNAVTSVATDSECVLFRKLKLDMTMEAVRSQVGPQYAPLIKQIGKIYKWSKNTDKGIQDWTTGEVWEIQIGFQDNGSYFSSMILGVAPKALTESIKNGSITLREAEHILGNSKPDGYIYQLLLPSNKKIILEANINNIVFGINIDSCSSK